MMQESGAIVIDVIKQPPITREVGMGEVVLGAVGLTGTIMIAAVTVGLLIGLVVVGLKMVRSRRPTG